MRDYINIGSSPYGEDCAQLGTEGYDTQSKVELQEFKRMMETLFPPPVGCGFRIKSFSHDFGMYKELVAVFDDDSDEAVNWAYNAEANAPENWDDEALKALNLALA